ncbi:hypothetical protein TWF173_008554 [Orbilia oligospora]|uniref:Uncharacterized protein n=2 Tax=Orbilia oligospora TaxID=2813651 RepID=G1XC47_ARTOA|nr:hypothetical protein AOL_s00078g494 [Orbilia oligospora ATCC 24927]EGX49461.1 hypothetical protein AOL_s00078g494 [Orbilia oligospora ATCC 24927]KAF3288690.1 hypothetical protein TWF970_005747 [Orbilia oligospora]KAF3311257.1 hypothetical protein TWF173_008554 [Orbilia oligospora]
MSDEITLVRTATFRRIMKQTGYVETIIYDFQYIKKEVWDSFLEQEFGLNTADVFTEKIQKDYTSVLAPERISKLRISVLREQSADLRAQENQQEERIIKMDPASKRVKRRY